MRTTMLRFTAPLLAAACAVALAAPALAETKVPGDPHANDPVGIVADPCPPMRSRATRPAGSCGTCTC